MNWKNRLIVSALSVSFALQGHAAEMIGARAVLAKATGQQAPEAKPEQNLAEQLRKDLKAFGESSATLSAKDAASGWLKLVDQWIASARKPSPDDFAGYRPGLMAAVQPNEILSALPGPDAWDELAKQVDAKPVDKGRKGFRQLGLKLIASRLKGDVTAKDAVIATFEKELETLDRNDKATWRDSLSRLKKETRAASPKDTEALMEEEIKRRSGAKGGDDMEHYGRDEFEVPDLVTLLGKDQAESILRRLLVLPDVQLKIEVGDETRKLARKLALELSDKLLKPQWELTKSLDGVALHEALTKRFPGGRDRAWETREADIWYLLGLIAANRTSDATKLVVENLSKTEFGGLYLDPDALAELDKAGHTKALNKFLGEMLGSDPQLPLWQIYTMSAARLGQTDKVEELARKALKKEGATDSQKREFRGYLRNALLAADKVDDAVVLIREELADTAAAKEADDEEPLNPHGRSVSGSDHLGVELARLGKALNRPEWIEEGVKALRLSFKDDKQGRNRRSLFDVLVALDRADEAEALAVEILAKPDKATPSRHGMGGDRPGKEAILSALVKLYAKAGRHPDVIALFEEAPWWSANDISGVKGTSRYQQGGCDRDLPHVDLANALIATGRKAEARKILHAQMDLQPGCDSGYEALLALDGAAALERLDLLFSRDQFEERPLIWKAEWFRREKNYAEAEKLARQAIAIDPSDGEQGKGDRLRAYAVLAEIRAGQGDIKQAEFFRGAVAAIRLSEKADDLHGLGLLKRAIALYEESLKLFADAYCIQSRLAIQMADLGLFDEAEAHYRKAYELMPDSFGRIESHCFGCERAFVGERAQSLAGKVFTKLVQERPDKPQVHYLIGYLREHQGLYAEAAKSLKEAVRLDPDYLNAWSKLLGIGERISIPASDSDAAAVALLRLDPLAKRHSFRLGFSGDLRQIHAIVKKGAELQPKPVKELFVLAASKKQIEEDEKKMTPEMKAIQQMDPTEFLQERTQGFGSILLSDPAVAFATQLISYGRSSFY